MMRKETKELLIFLAATFAWTWGFYIPIVISQNSPYRMPWMILLICGGMGPSVIGLLMVLFTYDRQQRGDYWRRCFSLKRISAAGWAVIFLIFPLVFGITAAFTALLGQPWPEMKQLFYLLANPLSFPLAAFISFMSGPWSEEFGWRGYALDRFLLRFGRLWGTVWLGIIWAAWHLPLFWMPATWHGQIGFGLTGFWMTVLYTIGLSLIMTRVYLSNRRSIFTGMLLHFTSNFTSQLLAPENPTYEVVRAVLVLTVGLILILPLLRSAPAAEQTMAPGTV